jgi:hypothetical protein
MFGLNDNNSQIPGSNNPNATNTPSPAPANPFSSDDGPAGELSPPAQPQQPAIVTPPASSLTTPASPKLVDPSNDASSGPTNDLLGLKQQALQNLQPLVSHLEQSPEEKFKTTMMLIQATDNSALVKQAYEAANQITDEKARAQALLDVVNEINYFTHHTSGEAEA